MPTLFEVMEDDDFVAELRQSNEHLINYLTTERMYEMMRVVIEEPKFNDSPSRCFKLPFIATQAFCVDSPHMVETFIDDPEKRLLGALFSFILVPEEVQLNSTLCGYFNKILSFWLLKKPLQVTEYLYNNMAIISSLIDHVYLNSSMNDIVIRICCVQGMTDDG